MMVYLQAIIFLSVTYQTPKDELFQRATSFQDSPEEELKTHYATVNIRGLPDYSAELQTLQSMYYKELMGSERSEGTK